MKWSAAPGMVPRKRGASPEEVSAATIVASIAPWNHILDLRSLHKATLRFGKHLARQEIIQNLASVNGHRLKGSALST